METVLQQQEKKDAVRIATAKPVRASGGEIRTNPRARSALLRVATKN